MTYDPERARRLLAHVEQSRRDFHREVDSRRRLLSTLEPLPESDEALARAVDDAWQRLYQNYAEEFVPHHDARVAAMRAKGVEVEARRAEEARIVAARQARRDQTIREAAAKRARDEYERGEKHGRK